MMALVLAIAGMPPFGAFMSEFLIVSAAFGAHPALGAVLVAGLLVAFGALAMRLHGMVFGDASPDAGPPSPLVDHLDRSDRHRTC